LLLIQWAAILLAGILLSWGNPTGGSAQAADPAATSYAASEPAENEVECKIVSCAAILPARAMLQTSAARYCAGIGATGQSAAVPQPVPLRADRHIVRRGVSLLALSPRPAHLLVSRLLI
jgi:hypothetical protein